jgi:hypothetical protein
LAVTFAADAGLIAELIQNKKVVMKKMAFIGAGLLVCVGAFAAEESNDPLLDAKLELAAARLRYTEQNPKIIYAEARVQAIAKVFSETAEEYRAHIKERIMQEKVEDAELALRYTDKHPKRIAVAAKLAFLQQELEKAGS